jgi:pyrroloquinoline quinone biosynthesis protein B
MRCAARLVLGLPLLLACTAQPAPRDCACESPVLDAPEPEPEAAPHDPLPPLRTASTGPRLRILGIAQDGGLPHAACECERCDAAREDASRASPVASVAVLAPEQVWIVDATPDLPRSLEQLADVRTLEPGRVDRAPLSGILLTHAHMGHYLGLAYLGYEAIGAQTTPVHASARMVEFLRSNAPWDQLVRLEQIATNIATPGHVIELGGGLRAEPLLVPHRGEYTDTFGWYLAGPSKRALYIPDTDPWAKWTTDLDVALTDVDLLLIDGTFYSADELPGRDVSEIGHPLMTDSMGRLAEHVAGGLQVWFIHLNHSNPTLDPSSPQRRQLEARGFEVAAVGDEFPL